MSLQIDLDPLRKYKLCVATPCYGGQLSGLCAQSLLNLQKLFIQVGIDINFSMLFNESLITRARNYMVDEFLRTDFTHLLFIDSDINFDPLDILALMHFDKDINGIPYPKKRINWKNVVAAVKKHGEDPNFDPETLENVVGDYVFNLVPGTTRIDLNLTPIEVMELGTGVMMIKREVFDKFREEYPHTKYRPDHTGNFAMNREINAYFDCTIDPDTKRYLSEDYQFCQMWRAIGGKVFMCPWMKTKHIGTYAFSGDLQSVANSIGSIGD